MPLPNFPNNPTLNQEFTYGTGKWRWNGRYWDFLTTTTIIGATGATGPVGPNGATGPVGPAGVSTGKSIAMSMICGG